MWHDADAARGAAVHVEDTLRRRIPGSLPRRAVREQAQHGLRGPAERGGLQEQAAGAGSVEQELRHRTGGDG